jgi:hypothetical protein
MKLSHLITGLLLAVGLFGARQVRAAEIDTTLSFSGNVGGPDRQNAPNITSDVQAGIGRLR